MARIPLTRRFLYSTPYKLTDAELLELLLSCTAQNPAELSKRLLAQYQNIANLVEADTETLLVTEGLDEGSAALLRLVPELQRRYLIARSQNETHLTDSAAFGRYLLPYFYGAKDEMVYLLCLDASQKAISCRKLGHGDANSTSLSIRTVAQAALHANATAVVLAHNHPSGISIPSKDDISMTNVLRDTLQSLDILLVDHIIIANDSYTSMRTSGYFAHY